MTGPSPNLGPAEVVLAQLAAFRREPYEDAGSGGEPDDSEDASGAGAAGEGLAQAWEYASPGNRAATGPLPRFARMLRHDAYRGLLGHRAVQLGPLQQDGRAAQVEVLVLAADDSTQGYTWVLGQQSGPPHDGCWLTDGVVRHPDRSR